MASPAISRLRSVPTEVVVKTVESAPTAVVRAATTWTEFPKVWGQMLGEVWAFLRSDEVSEGLYEHGHNVMVYMDDVPNVEIGVQVRGSFDPVGRVVPSTLPGGLVATTTHAGPAERIRDTHDALYEWCRKNGHGVTGVRWEVYGDPDPSTGDFTVDVSWLLTEPKPG